MEPNLRTAELLPIQELKLVHAEAHRTGAGHPEAGEVKDYAELYYVVKGKAQLQIGQARTALETDDLLLLPPKTRRSLTPENGENFHYYLLGLAGIDFAAANATDKPYVLVKAGPEKMRFDFLFDLVFEEIEQRKASYQLITQNILQILIMGLFRRARNHPEFKQPGRSLRECERAIRFMDENLSKPLTLDQLAELTHLSKFYLVHIFKREVGMTPIEYLNYRRIQESKRLLATTNHPIAKISEYLGFSNQSYFGRRFKEAVGMVPSAFRKKARENPEHF